MRAVRHIDGNPLNNDPSNLWPTRVDSPRGVVPRKERGKVEAAIRLLLSARDELPYYGLNVDPRKGATLDKIIERLEAWLR